MPKTPIDYSKTIIYRIVCKDPTVKECYVGSTTDFTRRKSGHKGRCNNINDKKYNYKVYQFIRANGGWENWDMIEIEKYNAIDKLDAEKKERCWLEYYNAILNKYIPSRTQIERTMDNKDQIIEYKQDYYKKNREYIIEKTKNYYQENKESVLEYHKQHYIDNKEKIQEQKKTYREENKEHIIDYAKEYRENNNKKINENRKEKITCECGVILSKSSLTRHKKSPNHLAFTVNAIHVSNSGSNISSISNEIESDIL